MPHDNPDVPELVRTAHEFVTRIIPQLDGLDRYHAMCTAFLLEIAQRELTEWGPLPGDDDRRLRNLLGNADKPQAELTAAVSAAIRAGDFDDRMPELLPILIEHVKSKVTVAKPSHLVQDDN
jgi:hypothetical protein